jgi:hypothetical protein
MRVIKLPRIEVPNPHPIPLPKRHPEDSTFKRQINVAGRMAWYRLCGDGRIRPSRCAKREEGNEAIFGKNKAEDKPRRGNLSPARTSKAPTAT